MKNIIIILFLLAITLSCGKKGDPIYKESKKQINISQIL